MKFHGLLNKWTCACHTKCSNKFPFQPTALHPVIAALKAQVKIYRNAFVLAIDTLKWPQTMIPNVLLIYNCNSGLYVLSSEPVKMPWFDSIYADIGDEQSLSQIIWGIPGRSNAINITKRLGLPDVVVGNARELHGTASAEINEVIEDMEKLKQKLHEHIHEARHHLKLARELHRNLVVSERRIREHATSQRYIKIQEISDGGGVARSLLHKKVRQHHASPVLVSKADDSPLQPKMASFSSQSTPKESNAALVSESNVKNRELGNPEIRFKTHPNINKDLFSNENILGSKDPNRPFPASESGDGLLKWRMQSKDASAVPLTSKFLYVHVSMLDDGLILLKVASIVLLKGGPPPKYS
ncbi:hypothetical protein Tco_1030133 [Tanacetum coccineum]|uniref:Uncharacterized protein n=1 Tax=Tanacetum coccineum TaxID=301880 RepID=A0ABQ5G5D0_9ASTR